MNAKLPRERESKVLRSVMIRLRHRFGIRLFRRNIGAIREGDRFVRFGRAGESDLWGIDPGGAHWEIEVKRPGGKPTPKQITWLREMHGLGCVAFWGDNVSDIERVAEAILSGGRVVWEDNDFYIEMPRLEGSNNGVDQAG